MNKICDEQEKNRILVQILSLHWWGVARQSLAQPNLYHNITPIFVRFFKIFKMEMLILIQPRNSPLNVV